MRMARTAQLRTDPPGQPTLKSPCRRLMIVFFRYQVSPATNGVVRAALEEKISQWDVGGASERRMFYAWESQGLRRLPAFKSVVGEPAAAATRKTKLSF